MPLKNSLTPVQPPLVAIPMGFTGDALIAAINNQFTKVQQAPAATPVYIRTLLVKDTTVGDDVADHVVIYAPGTAQRVMGQLRKAITQDLVVRANIAGSPLIYMRIPAATLVGSILTTSGFFFTGLLDLQVVTWDIISSDGSSDPGGVASFTLQWGA